jgi:hypothetical protein
VAKSSGESFQKRAREKARQEKQAEKRAKRQSDSSDVDEQLSKAEEDALMREFAALSARYESEQISAERYQEERHRIFVELGLESDG